MPRLVFIRFTILSTKKSPVKSYAQKLLEKDNWETKYKTKIDNKQIQTYISPKKIEQKIRFLL